jgi:hypothetical protein
VTSDDHRALSCLLVEVCAPPCGNLTSMGRRMGTVANLSHLEVAGPRVPVVRTPDLHIQCVCLIPKGSVPIPQCHP